MSDNNSGHEKQTGAVEPRFQNGDQPTATPRETKSQSKTPEDKPGHINPSAPEESNVTPGSAGEK